MAEAAIWEFTGVSEADYAAVSEHLGIDVQAGQGHWPAGMLSHAAGTADDGAFIVSECGPPERICRRSWTHG